MVVASLERPKGFMVQTIWLLENKPLEPASIRGGYVKTG